MLQKGQSYKKAGTIDRSPSKTKKNVQADGRDRAKGIEVVCSLAHRLLTASHYFHRLVVKPRNV
jgi:hypothetical protein